MRKIDEISGNFAYFLAIHAETHLFFILDMAHAFTLKCDLLKFWLKTAYFLGKKHIHI